jgi:hypothetical protein
MRLNAEYKLDLDIRRFRYSDIQTGPPFPIFDPIFQYSNIPIPLYRGCNIVITSNNQAHCFGSDLYALGHKEGSQ